MEKFCLYCGEELNEPTKKGRTKGGRPKLVHSACARALENDRRHHRESRYKIAPAAVINIPDDYDPRIHGMDDAVRQTIKYLIQPLRLARGRREERMDKRREMETAQDQ